MHCEMERKTCDFTITAFCIDVNILRQQIMRADLKAWTLMYIETLAPDILWH